MPRATISSLEEDDTARQRFWREARAAASVNHPNICQVYEIDEDSGELFIAMELLEGAPLTDRLANEPMDVSEAIAIGRGVLAALSALHERGLVHRDLKPSNVFLTPHGVKVLDFGHARAVPSGEMRTASGLTHPGIVIGTPSYMAPEQALGENVDARADLFAAGALLFEMLAGRPAFTGATTIDILHATANAQPPALTGSPAVAADRGGDASAWPGHGRTPRSRAVRSSTDCATILRFKRSWRTQMPAGRMRWRLSAKPGERGCWDDLGFRWGRVSLARARPVPVKRNPRSFY